MYPALAAIHLDLQHVEGVAKALPFPADGHDVAFDFGGDFRVDGGEVGAGFLGSDDAEILADDFYVAGGIFDVGDEFKQAVERNGLYGDGASGQRGRDERREDLRALAGAE